MRALRLVLWVAAGLVAAAIVVGILFAGSSSRIPAGVSVAGIKLSGLTPGQAEEILADLSARYAVIPVVLTAGGKRWEITPESLDVRVDWARVVAEARDAGDAPLPLRGLKRVQLRLFGTDVTPTADVYDAALEFRLAQIATEVGTPAREAAIVLDGLEPRIVPGRPGNELDVGEARRLLLAALGGFDREPIALSVRVDDPEVTAADLQPALTQVRTALSRSVRLALGESRWRIRPPRLARMLVLPANGSAELSVGGSEVDRYLRRLARSVNRPPARAGFEVGEGGVVQVVPAKEGRRLDAPATRAVLLSAALSKDERVAKLVVDRSQPDFTTENAKALGLERLLSSYATAYSGTADRIHNLQLAVSEIDGTILAPGETFSFNAVVGERTEERGFRIAPVIVGDEYEDDVGGGVSQVATTVFNAAWEAGLDLIERHAHALYISRYQLGRDATVNFPNLDLRFRNDTDGTLLVRGGWDESGIVISILGPDTGRRVESLAGELETIAPPVVKREPDATLLKGDRVVVEPGEPARRVSVTRRVYAGDAVLYEETFTSEYASVPKLVRVGTEPRPVEKEPPSAAIGEEPGATTGEEPPGETAPEPPVQSEPPAPPDEPPPPAPPAEPPAVR